MFVAYAGICASIARVQRMERRCLAGDDQRHGRTSIVGDEFGVFQVSAELTAHLTRVPGDLADHVTLHTNVIAWPVERHTHPLAGALSGDDPGESDLAGIVSGHDLTASSFTDAPLRRAGGIDDALEFATT